MKLKYKCEQLGKKLVIINEDYTTKTCSSCGMVNVNMGASETFKCPNCKRTQVRDINAAKNIFHKSLTRIF